MAMRFHNVGCGPGVGFAAAPVTPSGDQPDPESQIVPHPQSPPGLDRVLYVMASCGFGCEVFSVLSASAALRRDSSLWHAGSLRAVNVRRGARARSLLACAAAHGNVARLQELLSLGADPSLAGAGGRTPVMEATAGRHANVVAILLAAGALPIEPFAGRRQIASRGHRGPITAAASVDGTLFASDINSECLRVWGLSDAGQLEPIAELFAYDRLHRRTIVRCVLPLLCGALVAGCNDGSLLVWPDAASVGPRMVSPRILTGHRSTAWSLCALPALLPKGRVFASASFDCTVRLWDAGRPAAAAALAVLEGHTDYALAVAATSDGLLASGSRDHTIRLWDVSAVAEGGAASCVQVLTGHAGWVEALVTLRCGTLASASDDGCVRLWRRESPASGAAATTRRPTQEGSTPSMESACPPESLSGESYSPGGARASGSSTGAARGRAQEGCCVLIAAASPTPAGGRPALHSVPSDVDLVRLKLDLLRLVARGEMDAAGAIDGWQAAVRAAATDAPMADFFLFHDNMCAKATPPMPLEMTAESIAAYIAEAALTSGAECDLVIGSVDRMDAGNAGSPGGDSGAWASVGVLSTGVGLRSLAQLIDGSLAMGGLADAVFVWSPLWEKKGGQAAEATQGCSPSAPALATAAEVAARGLASGAGVAVASLPPPSSGSSSRSSPVAPQQPVRLLQGHGDGGVHALVVLPDGRLVTGCPQGVLCVWA